MKGEPFGLALAQTKKDFTQEVYEFILKNPWSSRRRLSSFLNVDFNDKQLRNALIELSCDGRIISENHYRANAWERGELLYSAVRFKK